MDSYAVLRGVSGISDYLSKDRYYLDKMIRRSDDYGAGYQLTIDAHVAHHNQLVTTLNNLFETIGGELGEFAPQQALFPLYVDTRRVDAAPVVVPEPWVDTSDASFVPEVAPDSPEQVETEPVSVPVAPAVEQVVEPDVTPVPEAPVVAHPERSEHPQVEVVTGEAPPETHDETVDVVPEDKPVVEPIAPKAPVTAREHVEVALSQHEAATGTALDEDDVEEPTAVSVLPSDTPRDETGKQDLSFEIPGFASSGEYQSVIHDDIARINGDTYGRPSAAPAPESDESDAGTWHDNDGAPGDDAFEGDTTPDHDGQDALPEQDEQDEQDGYSDDAFGDEPDAGYPDEDPFNER